MKETLLAALGSALFFIVLMIPFYIAECWRKDCHAHKIEAVRHGAAEWRTDENGQVSFHWKTNPAKP